MKKKTYELLILLLTGSLLCVITNIFLSNEDLHEAKAPLHAASTSPLLFGTNLGLYDASDQIFNIQVQQALVKNHVNFVRMPFRSATGSASEISAMQIIKKLGITPNIIVHDSASSLSDDKALITQALNVFGDSSNVYVDFGNEPDNNNLISEPTYVGAWNAIIPTLKRMAPNFQFGGPVSAWSNTSYISSFMKDANPKPDYIVWHRYGCAPGVAKAQCLIDMNGIVGEVSSIRAAMVTKSGSIGNTVRIIINEWNYNYLYCQDSFCSDNTFMHDFTVKELQLLSQAGVYASAQYWTPVMFNTDGSLRAQGQGFLDAYNQLSGNIAKPTTTAPLTITATPTPTIINTPIKTVIPTLISVKTTAPITTVKPTTKINITSTTTPTIVSTVTITPIQTLTTTPTNTVPVTQTLTGAVAQTITTTPTVLMQNNLTIKTTPQVTANTFQTILINSFKMNLFSWILSVILLIALSVIVYFYIQNEKKIKQENNIEHEEVVTE